MDSISLTKWRDELPECSFPWYTYVVFSVSRSKTRKTNPKITLSTSCILWMNCAPPAASFVFGATVKPVIRANSQLPNINSNAPNFSTPQVIPKRVNSIEAGTLGGVLGFVVLGVTLRVLLRWRRRRKQNRRDLDMIFDEENTATVDPLSNND